MSEPPAKQYAQHLALAQRLGPTIVARGVLQHFFVSPLLPMGPLGPGEIAAGWRRLVAEIRAGRAPELLSLYLHIPFCVRRCRYCIYYSVSHDSPDRLERYLTRLHQEIDTFAPLFEGVGFTTCYLGGGTPTVLDDAQLAGLLAHLDAAFARRRGGAWAFECNPATVTEEKIQRFVDHGFNRVSFGVQTLDPRVLDGVGRGYQTQRHVVETMRIVQRHRLWTNVDLIRGLPGDSPESFLYSLEGILALGPTQVTIYHLSPYSPGDLQAEAPGPPEEALERIEPLAARYDYDVKQGPTFIGLGRRHHAPDRGANRLLEEHARATEQVNYDDTTVQPMSLLGIGPTARSYIYGQLRYENERHPVDAPFEPELAGAIGRAVTMDEERQRFVVYQLERPEGLLFAEYAARFGEAFEERFAEALAAARAVGMVEDFEGGVRLRATERDARFATELFFLSPGVIASVRAGLEAREHSQRVQGVGFDDGSLPLEVSSRGARLVLRLVVHAPGRPHYHRRGRYAFYIASDGPDGQGDEADRHARVLAAFVRRFDRVVRQEAPRDLVALRAALTASVSPPGRE